MPLDLPPVARDRSSRLAAQPPTAWAADAGSLAMLSRAGFDFVGEVTGCVASVLSADDAGICGYRGRGPAPIRLGANLWQQRRVAYPKRAEAAYGMAIERLRAEAIARDADGVVAVTRSSQHLAGDLVETVLTGFAVRARTARRPTRPFLTSHDARQVANLIMSGWVPVDLHVAVQMGIRHDDTMVEHVDQIRAQSDMRRANFEIPGYTELAGRVRASVRDKIHAQFAAVGADGGSIARFETHTRHAACLALMSRTDRIVWTVGWADSIAKFTDRPAPTRPLPLAVLPLAPEVRRSSTS